MEWFLVWVVCVLVATAIGSSKGEAGLGFVVGFVFGPLGVLFALMSSGDRRPCPFCAEKIKRKAVICPHCNKDVSAHRERGFWAKIMSPW